MPAFPWSADPDEAVEISFEFPPPASRDTDDEEEEQEQVEDVDFYEAALKEMRARRHSEEALRKKQRSLDLDSLGSGSDQTNGTATDMTESTASLHSFLSWASSSAAAEEPHTQQSEERYWRELRRGRAPTPPVTQSKRNTDGGALQDLLGKFAGNINNNSGHASAGSNNFHASLPNFSNSMSVLETQVDGGDYVDSFRQLQYSKEDLQFLAFGETRDFYKLQRSLRREGAVTNELLKQVLPMVVSQSQQKRKMRERMAEQQRQQALSQILEMEPDEQAKQEAEEDQENNATAGRGAQGKDHSRRERQAGGTRRRKKNKSLSPTRARAKSPLQKALAFLVEEKKEEVV